jgi:hypothetical protein
MPPEMKAAEMKKRGHQIVSAPNWLGYQDSNLD